MPRPAEVTTCGSRTHRRKRGVRRARRDPRDAARQAHGCARPVQQAVVLRRAFLDAAVCLTRGHSSAWQAAVRIAGTKRDLREAAKTLASSLPFVSPLRGGAVGTWLLDHAGISDHCLNAISRSYSVLSTARRMNAPVYIGRMLRSQRSALRAPMYQAASISRSSGDM